MRFTWGVLALLMSSGPVGAQTAPGEPSLKLAIHQIEDGQLGEALLTLDAVVRDLTADATTSSKTLAQAHLYRGVAFVGLLREEPARAAFLEALRHDPSLIMKNGEFPDRVVRVFEAVRQGKTKSALERPSTAPRKAGIGGLGLAAIAGGVALVAGGDSAASGEGTSTSTTSTTLSAAVTSVRVRPGNSLEADFLSAQPSPGSTVSGYPSGTASFASTLRVRFTMRNRSLVDAEACGVWIHLQSANGQCVRVTTSSAFRLPAGASLAVEVGVPDGQSSSFNCPTPALMESMVLSCFCQAGPAADWGFTCFGCAERTWSIYYRITP